MAKYQGAPTIVRKAEADSKAFDEKVRLSALEVCYENALYKFTFDIDI